MKNVFNIWRNLANILYFRYFFSGIVGNILSCNSDVEEDKNMTEMRLHKYLAACGIGSRRTCENYITQRRVAIDGITVTELGTKIDPENNTVTFDGKEVILPQECYWIMMNKPPKYICSVKDPQHRPSCLDLLPPNLGRIYPVGRLDFMSEGLLLITNDGELANKVAHPRYEIQKTYEVQTVETLTPEQMHQMEQGLDCKGEHLRVLAITQNKNRRNHPSYLITLGEGRHRHIRRMLAALQIHIVTLKRIAIGPLHVGRLKQGEWRFLTPKELKALQQAVKE
jgi:23S rRNA pseudouridine2605 synthase